MSMTSAVDWEASGSSALVGAIGRALGALISTKHLYQSVTLDPSTIEPARKGIGENNERFFRQGVQRAAESAWQPAAPMLPGVAPQAERKVHGGTVFSFPPVKIYCAGTCQRLEPFSPIFVNTIEGVP